MGCKVFYFSRTGNSKRIAQKIAKSLSTKANEIQDGIDFSGFFGYIKAIFYSITNKKVNVKINENLKAEDEIIVVSPLWCGKLAPAVRGFLKKCPCKNINLVVSSISSNLSSKYKEGYKSITEIFSKNNNEDALIDELIKKLS